MTTLRPAGPDDAEAMQRLLAACWAAYPGIGDPAGQAASLRRLVESPPDGGSAWVLIDEAGRATGMAAAWPDQAEEGPADWELGRLYVDPDLHGQGVGAALLQRVEESARAAGARRLHLWSDTRLTRAHGFYEKHSFVRQGPLRVLDDGSGSLDVGYDKPLAGTVVRRLDIAAAESAIVRLAGILVECVAQGASVSFLPPLAVSRARAFWREVARDVATGRVILLAAWSDGVLSGTVTLRCDTPENQPHRAEVVKLLVDPAARRYGIARALMTATEAAARDAGRRLLTLDTRAGDAAEPLYRAMGWVEAGRIPGYAFDAQGLPGETVLFWKRLDE